MIPASPPQLAPGFHGVPAGHVAAVVTALEMTERPPGGAPPLPPGLALTHVERPGLDWYRALFRAIGADWLWASRLTWDDAKLAGTLHDPKVEVFALGPAGGQLDETIGLLELDFREKPGTCEIAFFGLVASAIGRGLGRAMMAEGLARAWSTHGIERVWIHTCTLDDPRALAFYMRSGFRAFARQVEILRDPRLAGDLPREAAQRTPIIEV